MLKQLQPHLGCPLYEWPPTHKISMSKRNIVKLDGREATAHQ